MKVGEKKLVVLYASVIIGISCLLGLELSNHGSVIASVVHTVSYGLLGYCIFRIHLAHKKISLLQKDSIKLAESLASSKEGFLTIQQVAIETIVEFSKLSHYETAEHVERIKRYVRIIANQLYNSSIYTAYFDEKDQYIEDLVLASGLHDIGKTGISESILNKSGKLDQDEFSLIKSHTVSAGQILAQASYLLSSKFKLENTLTLAHHIAQSHHERWDGSGYPNGISGKAIPLSARIVAVADVYDALTSVRCYKDAWSHEEAVSEIASLSGTHFDPVIINAFLAQEKQMKIAASF